MCEQANEPPPLTTEEVRRLIASLQRQRRDLLARNEELLRIYEEIRAARGPVESEQAWKVRVEAERLFRESGKSLIEIIIPPEMRAEVRKALDP